MVFNHPKPDGDELRHIYQQVEDPLYLEEQDARKRTFQRSLDQLHGFASPPGNLLDVGCYTGVFMEMAAAHGWKVEGVELSQWAVTVARKTGVGPVYDQPLDGLNLSAERYEAITLWDVIEHLIDPAAMIAEVHRLLTPGGVLALSTHMIDSWAARILGTRYPFFMEMHTVHFSRRTIRRLLESQGFEVLAIKPHHRVLRLGYVLEKLYHSVPFPLIRWLSKKGWIADRFIRIGVLGLVNVYARKKNESGRDSV